VGSPILGRINVSDLEKLVDHYTARSEGRLSRADHESIAARIEKALSTGRKADGTPLTDDDWRRINRIVS
jgi:hypothetical protein